MSSLKTLASMVALLLIVATAPRAQPFGAPDENDGSQDQALVYTSVNIHGHLFTVQLARTDEEFQQGLMWRRALEGDGGMLFDFGSDQVRLFWMKNTIIPLDVLFLSDDGHVVGVHERMRPLDETPVSSVVPIRAALEVNGGTVARLGVKVGDCVEAPLVLKPCKE